jgi:hypothetical protein
MEKYSANLCYGLKLIDDRLINKINEDELGLDLDLVIRYGGSELCNDIEDDEKTTFVCIKKSCLYSDLYNKYKAPIKAEKLIAPKEWTDRLADWAKENECYKFKIGWWLFVTES